MLVQLLASARLVHLSSNLFARHRPDGLWDVKQRRGRFGPISEILQPDKLLEFFESNSASDYDLQFRIGRDEWSALRLHLPNGWYQLQLHRRHSGQHLRDRLLEQRHAGHGAVLVLVQQISRGRKLPEHGQRRFKSNGDDKRGLAGRKLRNCGMSELCERWSNPDRQREHSQYQDGPDGDVGNDSSRRNLPESREHHQHQRQRFSGDRDVQQLHGHERHGREHLRLYGDFRRLQWQLADHLQHGFNLHVHRHELESGHELHHADRERVPPRGLDALSVAGGNDQYLYGVQLQQYGHVHRPQHQRRSGVLQFLGS